MKLCLLDDNQKVFCIGDRISCNLLSKTDPSLHAPCIGNIVEIETLKFCLNNVILDGKEVQKDLKVGIAFEDVVDGILTLEEKKNEN